jgi:hypothetical protein
VNDFFYLFVAELFVIAAMWHNKSPRSEREHESQRPDPAVLFSRRSPVFRKQALSVPVRTIVERPQSKQQLRGATI